MATKQKCVTHLKPGDVVCWDGHEEAKYRWPVLKVEPHEIFNDAVSVSFTYVAYEPDGEGNMKEVSKVTQSIMYGERENVQILIT